MILVDTSVWVQHFRVGQSGLVELLEKGSVLGHPWVSGEVALGNLARRDETVRLLQALPQSLVATPQEVMAFVKLHMLYGLGIGYVDAQLLAATLLTAGSRLWTLDRPLARAAGCLGCGVTT